MHVFHIRTLHLPLPLLAGTVLLIAGVLLVAIMGVLGGAGMIRKSTIFGVVLAICAILASALVVTVGRVFFLRVIH